MVKIIMKKIKIWYKKVSALRTKNEFFFSSISCNNYDVVCVTETWLSNKYSCFDYFPSANSCFRADRDYDDLDCDRGVEP